MITKYNFEINDSTVSVDSRRLINQIWKLIPMRENSENWENHLNTIIEEIAGLQEVFSSELDFLILLSKLEGLKSEICDDFMIYRKTVFRCIDIMAKAVKSSDY